MAEIGVTGNALTIADMVLPLFWATKKALMRPVVGQERMIEGLNKQSADGADTELAVLAAGALIAIIEVHAECAVG